MFKSSISLKSKSFLLDKLEPVIADWTKEVTISKKIVNSQILTNLIFKELLLTPNTKVSKELEEFFYLLRGLNYQQESIIRDKKSN